MTAMAKQPGYDGAYFAQEPIRDFDGKGKRDLVRRIRYDVCERLYRYNPALISLEQRDAAVRLQCDAQLASSPVMASSATVGVSRADSDFGIHQAILDATGRVRACRAVLRQMRYGWEIVECIALNNLGVSTTARMLDISQGLVVPGLRLALDGVGFFYDEEGAR